MVNKNKVSLFLRFAISFGLLSLLFWIMRSDIGSVIGILKNSNKIYFTLALLICLLTSLGASFRLRILMSGQKISLSLKDAFYLTFIGYFFNNFFPTAIGGDIAKAYYASRKTNNKAASYAAVLADRLVGLLSCLSIAIIGIIFVGRNFGNNRIIWAVVMMFVSSVALFLFVLNRKIAPGLTAVRKKGVLNKIKEKFLKLYTAINFYKHDRPLLVKSYLLAVFMQAGTVVSIYFFILCIGGGIHLLKLFLIIPLVWAVSMLPSLNGLGVREGAFVYFLKGDIGAESAFSISILWLGMIIIYSVIGGILHLAYPLKAQVKGDAS